LKTKATHDAQEDPGLASRIIMKFWLSSIVMLIIEDEF
jgi:hypothetical protein